MADGIGQSCQPQLRRDIIAPSQDYLPDDSENWLAKLIHFLLFPLMQYQKQKRKWLSLTINFRQPKLGLRLLEQINFRLDRIDENHGWPQ
jgi:hypothetical protein